MGVILGLFVLYFFNSLFSSLFNKSNFALDQSALFACFIFIGLLSLFLEVLIFLSKLLDFEIGIVKLLFLVFIEVLSFFVLFDNLL